MKVCMLAPEFLPVWGGVGTYTLELIKSLPRHIEIHVVTPFRERFGTEKVGISDRYPPGYPDRNIHVHFPCRASDTFVYNGKFQYACRKFLPSFLKKEKIDLIHSHTAQMPDLLLRLRTDLVPTVTTVHTTIQSQMEGIRTSGLNHRNWGFSEKMTFLSYPFLRLAEKIYFLRGRYYITPSRSMKEYIQEKYSLNRKEISVVAHGVDTKIFSPSETDKQRRKTVLFVGRLLAQKGVQHLIRCVPSILKKHPETLFLFIGTGNVAACIEEFENLGVPKKSFRFLGYKDRYSLPRFYNAADVHVLPSLQENFPYTLLEAMACGVPSVASDVGGVSEMVTKSGMLVRPGSSKDISNAVTYLLDNPSVRESMEKEARRTVEKKFNLSTMGLKTYSVYKHVTTATITEDVETL